MGSDVETISGVSLESGSVKGNSTQGFCVEAIINGRSKEEMTATLKVPVEQQPATFQRFMARVIVSPFEPHTGPSRTRSASASMPG
jgi:hypothetical protein